MNSSDGNRTADAVTAVRLRRLPRSGLIWVLTVLLLSGGCTLPSSRRPPLPGRTTLGSPLVMIPARTIGNHLLVEVQKLGSEARTLAKVALSDQEGPLALLEVEDDAFWEGLAPLPIAEKAPLEGTLTIHRWQRSGLLDSYPGTVRQVRLQPRTISKVRTTRASRVSPSLTLS